MFFDDYARKWDTDRRINRAKVIAEEIADLIEFKKEYSAMEFGCGTGLISFSLHDKFESITLTDSSKGMIEVVKDKIEEYKISNIKPHTFDIFNEEIEERFDVIYSSMVLHHIEDTSKIIELFYKYLNEGGYLCIVDLDKEDGRFHKNEPGFTGHNGFEQEKLKDILSKQGFKKISSRSFYYDEKKIDEENVKYSLFIMKAQK